MGDVNLEIKLNNIDERVIKIEESGGGSGGDGYITSVSNDFNVVNKKLSLSNDVTTKLSKVDTTDNLSVELAKKIDKPASATNGQVLTYNGTSNEWEAQNAKGGADDTSIISDAYDELKTYAAGEYCIYNNLLWKCLVQHNGQTPTEGTYWTNVSVANEITQVNNSLENLKIYSTDEKIVGTWIDGKPIYQVTITGTTANGESVIYTPDGGIDTVISIKGQYLNGSYKNLINSNYSGNKCSIYATETSFYAQTSGAYDIKAIIEYVKS